MKMESLSMFLQLTESYICIYICLWVVCVVGLLAAVGDFGALPCFATPYKCVPEVKESILA